MEYKAGSWQNPGRPADPQRLTETNLPDVSASQGSQTPVLLQELCFASCCVGFLLERWKMVVV